MNHKKFTLYIKLTLGLISFVILLVISINRLMDPFALYDGPNLEGINTVKPYFDRRLRMTKAKAVQHRMPEGILLGSSRGEIGLDPLHPGWTADKVYNLSIAASSIYESLRYFQHAHAIQPTQQVVLGLGLRQFKYSELMTEDFSEESLAVSVDGTIQTGNVLKDFLDTNASLKTLKYSVKTLRGQNEIPPYLSNGEYNPESLVGNMKGRREDFINNEEAYCKTHFRDFSFSDSMREDSTLSYFRRLLDIAYTDKVDLKILIYPSHARQWEMIDSCSGLWDTWEKWKQQLVTINEEEAAKVGRQPFALWDFSGYNSYTSEEVPVAEDNETKMQWYWESSHFKKELGDRVLDRVFGYHESDREIAHDFGVPLSSKNIDNHLQNIRLAKKKWGESHPEDLKEIISLSNK